MNPQTEQNTDAPVQTPARRWIKPEVRVVGTVGEVLKAGTPKTSLTQDPMEPVGFAGPTS